VDLMSVLNVVILILVIYLAFRVGAIVMQVLLGLLAIGLVIWFVARLVGAAP